MKKLLVSMLIAITLLTAIGCGSSDKVSVKQEKEIPPIPHKVDTQTYCADCHKDGKNGAKITKHLDRPNCTGCHKEVN